MPKVLMFANKPSDGELYKELFLASGFEVRKFHSYERPYVVDLVVMEQPDILMCDVALGKTEKIDGFQAIRLLKADTRTQRIPIVIVTDMCDVQSREAGMKTGAEKFLCSDEHTPREIVEIFKNILKTPQF